MRARLAGLAAAAAIATTIGSGAAIGADAAAAPADGAAAACRWQWHDYAQEYGGLASYTDIHSGPFDSCNVRANTGFPSAIVRFHCWVLNKKNVRWWHIEWGSTMGWVRGADAYGPAARETYRCNRLGLGPGE